MCTSILLVALTGFPALASVEDGLTWHTNYSEARKLGQSEKKPLAVIVSSRKNGWKEIARDGELGKEAEKTLAERYVCVYVDSATEPGKRLAAALGIDGKGIVISNAAGDLMAFHHVGDLSNSDLARYLTRFADPDRVVEVTETNPPAVRQSFYPPQYSPGNFGGFGGSGGRSC